MDRWQELQTAINEWSNQTFGEQQSIESLIDHIAEEVAELRDDPTEPRSFADIIILLLKVAACVNMNADDLYEACLGKHRINTREREWILDAEGERRWRIKE
jgi:hypothetical protein